MEDRANGVALAGLLDNGEQKEKKKKKKKPLSRKTWIQEGRERGITFFIS